MISEYETPLVAISGEHELSAEELAKFAREELPQLVDEVLGELVERFELGLGLSLAPLGIHVTSVTKLPRFCQSLLASPQTCGVCLAWHSPDAGPAEDEVARTTCYAGVWFASRTFSIQGLGAATIFGGLARDGSRPDVWTDFLATYGDSFSEGDRRQLADLQAALAEEKPSRLPLDTVLEISAFFVQRVLEQKVRDLARSRNENLAKQMFLHEAAHGIASVESTFLGLEDLLRGYVDDFSPEDKEDTRQFLSVLKREYQIHRMALLNLLEYYHPAAYAEIQRSLIAVCNPTDILWDLLPLYKPLAQARHVRLEEDLKSWHEMPKIRLDKGAMTRAFHNVIWNAIKYSYRSIVHPTAATDRYIRISCRPLYNPGHRGQGKECAVEVENYGLGIKPDEISKVTRPTFRGSAAIKEKVLGAGLGLYETERILRHHGGRLRITSKQVHADTYVTRVVLILPYRTVLA
jgi:signal transduction histidine kinase